MGIALAHQLYPGSITRIKGLVVRFGGAARAILVVRPTVTPEDGLGPRGHKEQPSPTL